MAPANNRFGGPQVATGAFSHLQQPSIHSQTPQHQPSNSGGLPPPSYHNGFLSGNPTSINPFATTGTLNGLAGGFGPGNGLGAGGTGLASREAMQGFIHGAELQREQQAKEQLRRGSGGGPKGSMKSRIRDVWKSNLAQEMATLRALVDRYPYISMDTEFPGIVARPMGGFTNKADYHYQTLRCNVDFLKVIQLGITLFDENGEIPPAHPVDDNGQPLFENNLLPCPCTWQFNFQFSKDTDAANVESIAFLEQAGLDFDAHEQEGIDAYTFAVNLISSGLVGDEDVRWISFHAAYDFAYLVKLMLVDPLPGEEVEYFKFLKIWFPSIYDVKYMLKNAQKHEDLSPEAMKIVNNPGQKYGLQDLANELDIKRVGSAHTAGSDSLLTGKIFWEVRSVVFDGHINDDVYLGHVWGFQGGSSTTNYIQVGQNPAETPSQTPNLNGATIYNNNPSQGTPSTPASTSTAPSSTPVQQPQPSGGGSMSSWTPGGGGGVFGGFRGIGNRG